LILDRFEENLIKITALEASNLLIL